MCFTVAWSSLYKPPHHPPPCKPPLSLSLPWTTHPLRLYLLHLLPPLFPFSTKTTTRRNPTAATYLVVAPPLQSAPLLSESTGGFASLPSFTTCSPPAYLRWLPGANTTTTGLPFIFRVERAHARILGRPATAAHPMSARRWSPPLPSPRVACPASNAFWARGQGLPRLRHVNLPDPTRQRLGLDPTLENKDSADIITWREFEALRNEMRREFRAQDDVLNGKVEVINQKLDATNATVTTMADQVTDIQRSLADMRLAIENLTAQQQQEDDEDPELQDDAHNARGAPRGNRPRGLAPLGRNGRGQDEEDGLGKPKFSIPKFEGGADVEEYLTWELKIEKLWNLHPHYTEDRKIKLASSEFDGYALRWWDAFVRNRDEDGVKTVDEYYMEMEMLMQRGRVRESLEMTMQRFLNGLKYDIKGIVRHYSYTNMNQLLHHAREAESQLAEEAKVKGRATGAGRFTPRAPSSTAPAPSTRSAPYYTPPSKPVSNVSNAKKSESAASTSGSSMSIARNRDMLCHTCGGKGHFKRDCPNRKVMIINEDNEYETGDDVDPNAPEDDDYDTDGEDAYPSEAHTIVVSQRALNVLPSASTQRCNLFQTKALVGPDKACKVIIDGGSCRNLASKELCTKLKLKYLPHPHPYYIQWLSDNGEMKVNHMVRVEFEIGPYKDCIDFDVVPMTVCHLLLGRPWLYDRSVQHNGRANTYHLEYKGKKINLQPMSPQQIVNESRQKIEVNLEDAPLDRRENCNIVSDITKSERVNSLVSLATKEDMREFSEDPTAMPLVLLYRGTVLVSNDMTPLPLGVSNVLQEFGDVFPDEVPAGLPPL
ncbi:hypothetical protein QYE76_040024 [Lolium multiflorum]|uniref:CCHC-type domain-containing protein n=1 Tax=Lolium multiflorum TaxID=4521 RepID=A0AAD8TAZ4_LOLMU|nr:hypothetical protein QYE76_040024 [Lolium multiflorum]